LHAQLIVEARRHEVRSRSRLAAHRDLLAAAAGDSECRQFEASADGTSSVSIDRPIRAPTAEHTFVLSICAGDDDAAARGAAKAQQV
jgi:hypothetical protein